MLPLEIAKADSQAVKKGRKRWIQGIASTGAEDLQHEFVEQNGIDSSYFIKYGYYNNDHKPGFGNKVGQPTDCIVKKEGLWTKGFLFENHKLADEIWELANALEASQSDRKLGFSIQGKVLRRAGRRILKCWIQDVAITAAPINTNTWLDVVKSINAACKANGFCENPISKSCEMCMACDDGRKYVANKADAALAIDEEELDLKKKTKEKALSTVSGRALIPQSLEGKVKDQQWGRMDKSLSFEECVELIQKHRNLSKSHAIAVTEAVFELSKTSS